MASTNHAQAERALLCDLFVELGPDQPTLCEGWTTRDLAAHLVVRDRRPDAALGILIPRFAGYTDKLQSAAATKGWDDLVAAVRSGPPMLSPIHLGPIDKAFNTIEYFVHHEDVRRAQSGWQPRTLDDDLDIELWTTISRMSKLALRKAPAGVVLALPGGSQVTAKKADPTVTVTGTAGELVLFTNGRQAHARVELDGPADAAASLRTAKFGV
jgi:uncharacterized protein (TIGR03085 family)